ncbi:MAG: succinyl-CoA--3-ketoacid CoA transferase subunit B [Myxococcales bacterium]
MTDVRDQIAARAARLLSPGWVVNLGIGIPTLVARHLKDDLVFLHSENGLLGVGPPPAPGEDDPNLIDAGKRPITVRSGASYFDSAQSFAMIRGGHVDAAVLGALQVDERGRIANWSVPGEPVLGVGGAMDLLEGVREVIAVLAHNTRDGAPKLVSACTLPLSSLRPASFVVTELATFRVDPQGLVLTELAEGVRLDEVRARTGARFAVAGAQ